MLRNWIIILGSDQEGTSRHSEEDPIVMAEKAQNKFVEKL